MTTIASQEQVRRETIFSPCRQYRYTLWREWPEPEMGLLGLIATGRVKAGSYLMVIGLNPSTADETRDDPTIRRCIAFAKTWGFGALCMTNLFAFRATDPREMKRQELPQGEDNHHHILQCASGAGLILAAWGRHGCHHNADLTVRDWLISIGCELHSLGENSDGSPKHPLYVLGTTAPVLYPAASTHPTTKEGE